MVQQLLFVIGYDKHKFEADLVNSEISKAGPLKASDTRLYNNHVKITANHGMYCLLWMISKGAHQVRF